LRVTGLAGVAARDAAIRSPRTVAYVVRSPFVSGAERSLVRAAAGLDPERYRPFVFSGRGGDVPRVLSAAGLAHRVVSVPDPERRWPFPFLFTVGRLAAGLRRRRAAVVHVNDAPAYPAAALAAGLAHLPRICHLRFGYAAEGLRWYFKHGFERAVFPSRFLASWAQAECSELFPPDRCVLIHNGFDPPPAPGPRRLETLANEIGLAPSTAGRVVTYVGQVIEVKGVEEFLLMAKRLRDRDRSYRFLVVGEDLQAGPSYRARMEELAARLGIAGACRFTGYRDDVWDLLHLSDVVVVPSRVEPLGVVALEAGAAGRPVVATRVGGIPEVVRDGHTGLLVPPRQPEALSEAVWRVSSDPETGRRLGAAAKEHVAACFGVADQARKLADLYDEVLAEWRSIPSRRRSRRSPSLTQV
jgi:glycosyltransferase involved in cell wall biosynthesis